MKLDKLCGNAVTRYITFEELLQGRVLNNRYYFLVEQRMRPFNGMPPMANKNDSSVQPEIVQRVTVKAIAWFIGIGRIRRTG